MTYASFPIGPLTAVAIADAVGSGHEFVDRFPKRDGLRYKQHTMWPYAEAGNVSDDTHQHETVMQWMMDGGRSYTLEKALIRNFAERPHGGSPRMEAAFLGAIGVGGMGLGSFLSAKTDGSGAAMRGGVLGLRGYNDSVLMENAKMQAEITHSGDGIVAAQAAALLVKYLAHEDLDKVLLGSQLADVLQDDRFAVTSRPKKPGNKGVECVLSAIWILQNVGTLTELLQAAIDGGGDTDTVGVIAMAAAWSSQQYIHDLHWDLWFGLKDRDRLRAVELRWLEKGFFIVKRTGAHRGLRVA